MASSTASVLQRPESFWTMCLLVCHTGDQMQSESLSDRERYREGEEGEGRLGIVQWFALHRMETWGAIWSSI